MKYAMVAIRCLTATVLFLMLSQLNVWADTKTHLVLAVGYRALLLAAPLFLYFGLSFGMRSALIIGAAAAVSFMFSLNAFNVGLFALSMAVSGYICKYVNSQSARGAADNKVSLNVGSLLSGVLLMLAFSKNALILASAFALAATVYFAYAINWDEILSAEKLKNRSSKNIKIEPLPLLGWLLIGTATGIKLTGVFTIMPQYLLHKTGDLPSWFGSLVVINSFGVIFLQHKVLKILEQKSKSWTLIFSLSAMALLSLPELLGVHHAGVAALWISLLTIGECALSYYDKLSNDEGYLFPKEVMVGVGSFITVVLSREFGDIIYLSGVIGFICMLLGAYLTCVNDVSVKGFAGLKLPQKDIS